jgi:hypothetical protein
VQLLAGADRRAYGCGDRKTKTGYELAGSCIDTMTVTSDGKHVAFLQWASQTTVNVADLDGTEMRAIDPRLLTLTEHWNFPFAWTDIQHSGDYDANNLVPPDSQR